MSGPPDSALWLAAVVESSDDVIVTKTLDGIITSWNPAAERIFGYTAAEAIGRHITLIIPEERRSEEDYVLGKIRRGEKVHHFETVRVAKDGRRVDISLTVSPIRNPRGEIVGASKIARDITERKRLEEAARVEQEWLQTTLHSIGDAVIATDPRGVVTFLNPVAERLTGWRHDEAAGRPLDEVFPIVNEITRAPVENPVAKVIREGTIVGLANHTILLRRGGPWVPIDDSAAPIRARDGSLVGVVLVFRDVSGRRRDETRAAFLIRAAEELSSSLDYEATLTRVAQLAVPEIADWAAIDLEVDGRVERLAVTHRDPSQAQLIQEIQRRYPVDPDARLGTGRVLRTGEAELVPDFGAEALRLIARDDEHLALLERLEVRSYIGVPLRARGRTIGAIAFVSSGSGRRFDADDLTLAQTLADRAAVAIENARLFRAAEEARALAEAASGAKDEFLAMLGHELRNPLAPILTALKLMEMRGGDAHARERAVIERQVRHMTRLVDDLLDVSRITRGKVALRRERVELADVVARAVEMASPLVEAREHRLSVDVPRGLVVWADPMRLAQVVSNLLNNAARYTDPGGKIDVSAGLAQGEVELCVRDTGIGIAPEMLPKVFDVFVQGGRALDRAQGGLGLGLAIVRSLVALHGGSVSVESEGVGRGSRFRVRLPVAAGASQAPASPAGAARAEAQHPSRILLVDDNADAADLLGEMLRALGHDVLVANDGPSALAVAARERPDLALLDIGLPVMDGYELALRLRDLAGLERVKLVAVTGYGQLTDRRRSRDAGFDAHLIKPVDPEELRATIAALTDDAPRRTR